MFKDYGGGKDGVIICFLDLILVRSIGGELGNEPCTETDDEPQAPLRRISVHRWGVHTLKRLTWCREILRWRAVAKQRCRS